MSEHDPRMAALSVVMDAYERDTLPFLALAFLSPVVGEQLRELLGSVADDPVQRILSATPVPSPAYERGHRPAPPRGHTGPVSPVDVARWRSSRDWPEATEARSRFAEWMESGEPFTPDVLSNMPRDPWRGSGEQ